MVNFHEVWTEIATIGVQHGTTELRIWVAAAIYNLAVYLG